MYCSKHMLKQQHVATRLKWQVFFGCHRRCQFWKENSYNELIVEAWANRNERIWTSFHQTNDIETEPSEQTEECDQSISEFIPGEQ